jgi:hypothetical protein
MQEDHTTSILASILPGQNDLVSQTSYFQEGYFWFKLSLTKEFLSGRGAPFCKKKIIPPLFWFSVIRGK